MALFKVGNHLQLGRNIGNIFAQKHNKEEVLIVLTDIYVGLVTHATTNIKKNEPLSEKEFSGYKEEKYIDRTGYSTIEEGFLKNGLPACKLREWAKTHKDDIEVSTAVGLIRNMRETVLINGGANGTIPATMAKFLLTAQLGITDREKEDDKGDELPKGAEIEYIDAEEGGDFSYD